MVIGGCAGSTGGGIKIIRLLILFKTVKMNLVKMIHPKAVYSVKIGGRTMDERILSEVLGFFFIYIGILNITMLIVALEGKDMTTTVTAVVTAISNVGPGLEIIGPMGNFSSFTDLSKIVLSLCMIIGRLEIYPILLLLMPKFWVK